MRPIQSWMARRHSSSYGPQTVMLTTVPINDWLYLTALRCDLGLKPKYQDAPKNPATAAICMTLRLVIPVLTRGG